MEAAANEISQKMIDNYNRLKTAASGYSKKPVVAWTEYDAPSQYNNNTGSYNLKNDSFKVGLTNDAGTLFFFFINIHVCAKKTFFF